MKKKKTKIIPINETLTCIAIEGVSIKIIIKKLKSLDAWIEMNDISKTHVIIITLFCLSYASKKNGF